MIAQTKFFFQLGLDRNQGNVLLRIIEYYLNASSREWLQIYVSQPHIIITMRPLPTRKQFTEW